MEETAKTLTVTATSKLDETKSASATVTVTDEIVAPDITVTIDPAELVVDANPGQKGQFTAIVEGAEDETVTWNISGNTSDETLITNGQLFLGTDEKATEMTVTATSNENPDCVGTAKVIVSRPNKDLLQATYDYAKDLSTEGVTDSAKKFFEDALAKAAEVLENSAATQEEVDAAWDNLLEGIWGLGLVQGDKTNLELLIAKAESMMENEGKYVEDNWQKLVEALEAAKKVDADGDAMESDIQPVADDLLQAILMQKYKADKSILEELVNKAEGMDLSAYTLESVNVLKAALRSANIVLADESLSEENQDQVDAAAEKLENAIESLELKEDEGGNTENTGDSGNTGDTDNSGTTSSESGNNSEGNNNNTSDNNSNNNSSNEKPAEGTQNESPTTADDVTPILLFAVMMTVAGAGVYLFRRRLCK